MSMWSTLTLMKEFFLLGQTLGFQITTMIHIMIHIFSLVELIKEVDDGGSSSFGILVTFYLSIWKVASSFCILFKGINFITSMIDKTRKYKFDENPGQYGEVEGAVQGKGEDSKHQGGRFHQQGKKVHPLKKHKNCPKVNKFKFDLSQTGLGVQDQESLHSETQPRP